MTHLKCAEILIFPFVKHLYLFEIIHAFQRKEQLPFALISLLHIKKNVSEQGDWRNLPSALVLGIIFFFKVLLCLVSSFNENRSNLLEIFARAGGFPVKPWAFQVHVNKKKNQVDFSFWGFANLLCFLFLQKVWTSIFLFNFIMVVIEFSLICQLHI